MIRSARLSVRILVAWVTMAAPAVHAQLVFRIPSGASCGGCTIELSRHVTVGDADGPGMVHQQARAALAPSGRIYLTSNGDPGRIRIFGTDGRHIATIGSLGGGPGEFRNRPHLLFTEDGRLVAVDQVAHRATWYTRDHGVASTVPLPVGASDAALVGDTLVSVGAASERESSGSPLHVVDEQGRIVRSFGIERGEVGLGGMIGSDRRIAPSRPAAVWSAFRNRYRVERWTLDGRRTVVIDRAADWFAPWATPSGPAYRARPDPMIQGVREDSAGRLWVLIRVADADWKPRPLTPLQGTAQLYFPGSDEELAYDSIVEVLDTSTGRLLASARFGQHFLGFGSGDTLVSYEEDPAGNPRYVIWKLRFAGAG